MQALKEMILSVSRRQSKKFEARAPNTPARGAGTAADDGEHAASVIGVDLRLLEPSGRSMRARVPDAMGGCGFTSYRALEAQFFRDSIAFWLEALLPQAMAWCGFTAYRFLEVQFLELFFRVSFQRVRGRIFHFF